MTNPRPITPEDDALIVRLYRQGVRCEDIATAADRHVKSIHTRITKLKKAGKLEDRPRPPRRQSVEPRNLPWMDNRPIRLTDDPLSAAIARSGRSFDEGAHG